MWMNMFEGHINLLILIVLKWVLLLAYLNHQIPMSCILDNQEGKYSKLFVCYSGCTICLYMKEVCYLCNTVRFQNIRSV